MSIYIARVMMYRRRDMPSCVINAIISDREVAEFMNKLRNNESSVADVVNMLKSHKDYLAQFLAGAIDGDGVVDKDTVRISVDKEDVLFKIIKLVFNGTISYDDKKYLLKISASMLRSINVLNELARYVISKHRKLRLLNLAQKRFRFNDRELRTLVVDDIIVNEIISSLSKDEIEVLRRIKLRSKGQYTYAYISCRSDELIQLYEEFKSLMRKLSMILDLKTDLGLSVKLGNREVLIYSKYVVNLVRRILQCIT